MAALLFLALLADPEPATPPKGPPPRLVNASVRGDILYINETVAVPVTVSKVVEMIVDGKKVRRVVNETRFMTEMRTVAVAISSATFSTAGGKKIDKADALKTLATPGTFLLGQDGKVDPAWLKAFKADTLVVTTPPPARTPSSTDPVPAPPLPPK